MGWEIFVSKGIIELQLQVELIYFSNQIERYKVSGGSNAIVLQTDYPLQIRTTKNKGKVKWKLIEGNIDDATLLMRIMHELEKIVKGKM